MVATLYATNDPFNTSRKGGAMKAKLAVAGLKWTVRYLRDHPKLIPGTVDDTLVKHFAKALGA